MHIDLNLLKLDQRRELHLALRCHKNIYPDGVQSLENFFVKVNTVEGARRTRLHVAMTMKVPNIRSAKGRLAFSYWGPKFWNNVTLELRNTLSFTMFRKQFLQQLKTRFENHPT